MPSPSEIRPWSSVFSTSPKRLRGSSGGSKGPGSHDFLPHTQPSCLVATLDPADASAGLAQDPVPPLSGLTSRDMSRTAHLGSRGPVAQGDFPRQPARPVRRPPWQTGLMEEVTLAGGVANAGAVTRIGPHVLRPSNPHSPSIHRFLSDLRAAGFHGAPRPVGFDPDGRERLEFIEGDVAVPPFPAWVQTDSALASVAVLLRKYHEASSSCDRDGSTWSTEMADPRGGPVICHNDVCLENVVFRGGEAVGLLDFDFAAPGRPAGDLADFARMCVPIDDDVNMTKQGWVDPNRPGRLRLVADAYGLDRAGRREMVDFLGATIAQGGPFVRRRVEAGDVNFTKMWDEMGGAERFDRRRRWWDQHREEFVAALA